MVRTYQRTSSRRSYSSEKLLRAIGAVKNGESVNSVATRYDIPEPTLRRYVKKNEGDTMVSYVCFIWNA